MVNQAILNQRFFSDSSTLLNTFASFFFGRIDSMLWQLCLPLSGESNACGSFLRILNYMLRRGSSFL